jgi:5-methylcytosine-specific restriction enzyme subunit McrC
VTAYETADGLPGIALAEWRSGTLPGASMGERDLRLAGRLRALPRDARLDVQPAEGGVEVTTTGAVGIVRFSTFEVRIDPKLPGDHLQLFRMVEFASGLQGLVQLVGSPRMRAANANLLDFIVELLSSATERILAAGLRADYVERQGDLRALRGRHLTERQELERFGLYDRIVCRYDEHEHDIPDNQLLGVALARGSRIATLPRVRRRARALAALLEDLCDPRALDLAVGPDAFTYSRHNEHYRTAHALSWMVLDELGPDEALATGQTPVRSFLIDMNTLFERFLEQAFRLALGRAAVNVEAQRSDSIFWRPDRRERYARVRPDLVLERVERPQARLPVDAKYKRYDHGRVDVDDLTQVFLYAYAYRDPKATGIPRAVLVYPSEMPGEPRITPLQVRSVEERSVDAELTVVGVHIPTVLDAANAGGGRTIDILRELTLGMAPRTAISGTKFPSWSNVSRLSEVPN